MPDAYDEAAELIAVAPAALYEALRTRDSSLMETLVKTMSEHFAGAKLPFEKINLPSFKATPVTPEGKVLGPTTDAWRATSYFYYSLSLSRRGAHHDWLSPFVDIESVLRDVYWRDFWFVGVEAKQLPRAWVRWAFELLHSLRRVNDGTPCDTQMATYTVSCSHIVTADKRYADVIEKFRETAPFDIAQVVRVPSGGKAVQELVELMNIVRDQRKDRGQNRTAECNP